MTEPCGSLRVLRWIEGYEYDVVWCDRIDGPCKFPGTVASKGDEVRSCAGRGSISEHETPGDAS